MMRNHRSGGGGRKGAAQQPWTEQALIMQMNVLKSLLQQQLVDPKHLSAQCLLLSKILDSLVANKRTPVWRHELLPIIKQVCRHRESPELRPALLLLLLSVKNAYRVEWLPSGTGTERDEIFITLKVLFDSFTTVHEGADNAPATHLLQCGGAAANDIHEVKAYLDVISSRFYPRLQVKSVFVAIQAKVGYEVLMCDFHVSHMSLQDRVRLYVGQKDHTETSTCIITPPQVNFLVNGQQVERRVATGYLDAGAQMPSDITTLVRVGANVLQVIGEFAVSYFIAVTSSTNFGHSSKPTQLEEYVAPTGDEAMEVDDEVVEGASRVSLRCPISHQRLVTPVKASSCRHLQCFDYDSFLEINEKRPAWRCPCCNRLISCPDLRIDRQMEKVLRETDEKVYEVMLYQDGTWVPVATGGGEVQSPDVAEGGGVKPDDIIDLDSYVENERRRSDALFEPQQHDRKPDAQTLQALRNAPVISVPEFTPVQAPVQAPPQQQSSPAVTAEMQPTLLPAINHNFQVTFAQSHLSPGSSSRSTNPSRAYIPSAQLQPPPQTGASPSNPAQGEMRWRQAEQQRQQAVSEMRPQWRSTGAAQHTVPQPQPQQQQQQQQQFFSNQHAANAALQQRSAQQAPARTAGNWSTTTVHQWRTSTSAAQVATMNAAAAAAATATTTTTMNAAAAAAASDQHWRPVQRMRGSITNPPGARAQPPRGPVQSYGFSTTNAAPTFSYYGMDPIPVVGTPTNGAAAAAAANVSLYNGSTWVNGANFSSAPLLFSGVQTSDGWLSFDALNSGAPSSSSLR